MRACRTRAPDGLSPSPPCPDMLAGQIAGAAAHHSSEHPAITRRAHARLRWNTGACARENSAGSSLRSRLRLYRCQSPSFPSRQ